MKWNSQIFLTVLMLSQPGFSENFSIGRSAEVKTKGGCLNVRTAGQINSRISQCLKPGTALEIVGLANHFGFVPIKTATGEQKFVHQKYLKVHSTANRAKPAVAARDASVTPNSPGTTCVPQSLKFSADFLPAVPAKGSNTVWGGNATGGQHLLNPPYSKDFLAKVRESKGKGLQTFAYLEGPCGDTGGKDDGERGRCRKLHRAFNLANPNEAGRTRDSDLERWKPFTLKQMKLSKSLGIDHCEIDNLENNVRVDLIPFLREVKTLYDSGQIHCKLVLKNLRISQLESIKQQLAPTPDQASFISPFHIFETNKRQVSSQREGLNQALRSLKGPEATTIFSTNTDAYGSAFSPDKFGLCETQKSVSDSTHHRPSRTALGAR